MVTDIDYETWLYQNSNTPKAAQKRLENVFYLIDSLEKTLSRIDEDDDEGNRIQDAVAKLVLRDLMERQEEDDDEANLVQLMTLHASKGLEYPHVFMVGMEEDLLPHRNSIDDNNIEEERRLTYVGITRAKKTLVMSLAGKRKQYGEMSETTPSRFLDELPKEDVEFEGFGQQTQEQNKARGEETLSQLLKMFD